MPQLPLYKKKKDLEFPCTGKSLELIISWLVLRKILWPSGHTFVLVLLVWLMAWPLVKRNPAAERLLLAFLGNLCGRLWSFFGGVILLTKISSCFLLLDSLFRTPDNRDRVVGLLLFWHTPWCLWFLLPHIVCYPQIWILPLAQVEDFDLLSPFLWCLDLIVIRGKRHISSIWWGILACMLVFPLEEELGRDQRICFWTWGRAWSWYICNSTRSSHPERSYKVERFCYCFILEVAGNKLGFGDK